MDIFKLSKYADNASLATLGCGILIGLGLKSKFIFGGFSRKIAGLSWLFPNVQANHKLILVVRKDLSMGKGKMCAQCGHASVLAYKNAIEADPGLVKAWERSGQGKIVTQTENENTLLSLASEAEKAGLLTIIVQDAGITQVKEGSKTVLAIGPGAENKIDKITSKLKLL